MFEQFVFVMLLFIVMNERVRRDNTQSVQTTVLHYGQWLPFSTKDYVIDTTSRSRSTILSIHINSFYSEWSNMSVAWRPTSTYTDRRDQWRLVSPPKDTGEAG